MTLFSLWPCCHDTTSTSTSPINPFWQAASSCHNQDALPVFLVRLNPWCKKHSMLFDLGELQRMHPSRWERLWSRCAESSQPPLIFPSKSQYDLIETTHFLLGPFQGMSEHDFPMHSTEWREETLGRHSPGSTARFSSKHLNKLGSSHLKSYSSHGHLVSELPPAAGMCTFDSPRSLKGCKGTAKNDHRLRAQWIEHGLCSFVDLKRHCQDLKVKNWTKHAPVLSDGENLIKALKFWESSYFPFLFVCFWFLVLVFFFFFKTHFLWDSQNFCFVLPRA